MLRQFILWGCKKVTMQHVLCVFIINMSCWMFFKWGQLYWDPKTKFRLSDLLGSFAGLKKLFILNNKGKSYRWRSAEALSIFMDDLGCLDSRPTRAKSDVHICYRKLLWSNWYCVVPDCGIQNHTDQQNLPEVQGLSPRTCQVWVLNTGLPWQHARFKEPRIVELTLYCIAAD